MVATVQTPVSGSEEIIDAREPIAALSQFYRALNHRDIELIQENWITTMMQ